MRQHALPLAETTVDEVMRRWPTTIRDFPDFRMGCVGCPVASFHSVDEACAENGVDGVAFLAKLLGAAQGTQRDEGPNLQI